MVENLPVVVQQHAFSAAHVDLSMPCGLSIAEIVERSDLPAPYKPFVRVWVGDREVPRADWDFLCPAEGTPVYLRVIAEGGNGKSTLMMVASIALMVTGQVYGLGLMGGADGGLAAALSASTLVGAATAIQISTAIGGAIISMGGMLAMGALIKPPGWQTPNSGAAAPPVYQLTGVSNRTNPYGPIPRVLGKRRIYPLVAAHPYTEAASNDQYLRILLLAGYGPLDISNIRIGETPLSAFTNVEYEVLQGNPAGWSPSVPCTNAVSAITLYTNTVTEDRFTTTVPFAGTWVQRDTIPGTQELSVDITFPRGVFWLDTDGSVKAAGPAFHVQYRLLGSGTWLDCPWTNHADSTGYFTVDGHVTVNVANKTAFTVTGRVAGLAAGTYEVRMSMTTTGTPASNYIYDSVWTALRSVILTPPVLQPGVCLIAMRIKANQQLNGVPDNINCDAQAYHPVWNGSTWTWTLTRNPAWEYVDVLRRRGTEYLIPDSRIDLPAMLSWAAACDAIAPNSGGAYWQYDAVIEGGSIFSALKDISAHARAVYCMREGKYSVTRDVAQTVPVQHISPRNSWGYSWSKTFVDLPHALKVQFINAAMGGVQDETIVYMDGYNSSNATIFESLPMLGCLSQAQAWREGRYHLAVAYLRPDQHTVTMDIENLRCTQGSYVSFANDVISIGLGSGRIKQIWIDGGTGNVWKVQLDGPVDKVAGTAYAIRVRQTDGTSIVCPVVASVADETTDTLTLITWLAPAAGPQVDDLFMFGTLGNESAPMIVTQIAPSTNLSATLTLVDAQPGVWTADSGTIPAFNTHITVQGPLKDQLPFVPSYAVRSDDTALVIMADGTVMDRIVVSFGANTFSSVNIDAYEVQYKLSAATVWESVGRFDSSAVEAVISPVRQGATYDIRVRSLAVDGRASDWVATTAHMVAGKLLLPGAPSALTATGGLFQIVLAWTPPVSPPPELDYTEVWASTTDDRATAARLTCVPWPTLSFTHIGVQPAQRWYYWVRLVDTSHNPSAWYPSAANAGVNTTASADASTLLTQLTSQIDIGQLVASVAAPLTFVIQPPNLVVAPSQIFAQVSAAAVTALRVLVKADELKQRAQIEKWVTDATTTTDPVTGKVTLLATAALSTTTDAHLNQVDLTLNAQVGTITSHTDTLSQYGTRISSSETNITQLQGEIALTTTKTYVDSSVASAIAGTDPALVKVGADAVVVAVLESLLGADAGRHAAQNANIRATAAELKLSSQADALVAEASARVILAAQVGANAAAITNEQTVRSNTEGALAQSIVVLQASTGSNASAITTEQTARASGDSTNASSITTLAARVTTAEGNITTNASAITTEQTARASGDSTNASSITTVSAVANARNTVFRQALAPTANATGDLWFDTTNSNQTKRWDGVSWVATYDTRIDANASSITSEASTRASADSANASNITTVSARLNPGGDVNTNIASVTTQSSANASAITGIQAKYGVTVGAGGYLAGFQLLAGGGISQFGILADQFVIAKPDGTGATQMFTVGTVNGATAVGIGGNLIVDGSVITRNVAANNITIPASAAGGAVGSYGSNYPATVDLVSVSLTSKGGSIFVDCTAYYSMSGGSTYAYTEFMLYRDGTLLHDWAPGGPPSLNGSNLGAAFAMTDTPGAGTHTYRLSMRTWNNLNNGGTNVASSTIKCLETLR